MASRKDQIKRLLSALGVEGTYEGDIADAIRRVEALESGLARARSEAFDVKQALFETAKMMGVSPGTSLQTLSLHLEDRWLAVATQNPSTSRSVAEVDGALKEAGWETIPGGYRRGRWTLCQIHGGGWAFIVDSLQRAHAPTLPAIVAADVYGRTVADYINLPLRPDGITA